MSALLSGRVMTDYFPAAYYLPHTAPMVLLENVVHVDADSACCRVLVAPDGVLVPFLDEQGNLPGWYALEIMAQTTGVWSGWHGMQNNEPPKIGLLLGARALRCRDPFFAAGSVLDTQIKLLMHDDKISCFECEIKVAGEVVASARMNTYQPCDADIQKLFLQDEMA